MNTKQYYNLCWQAEQDTTLCTTPTPPTPTTAVKSMNNELYFNSNITSGSINMLIDEFTKVIDKHNTATTHIIHNDAPITVILYIDSPGGIIKDAFKFIDFVCALKRTYKINLTTVGLGVVASAATLILLIGDQRYMTPNSIFMIHELWTALWGTYTRIASQMKHIHALHERIVTFYLEKVPSLEHDQLEKLLVIETWFSANECADMGFAQVLQE